MQVCVAVLLHFGLTPVGKTGPTRRVGQVCQILEARDQSEGDDDIRFSTGHRKQAPGAEDKA